jgi:hypothetical protein
LSGRGRRSGGRSKLDTSFELAWVIFSSDEEPTAFFRERLSGRNLRDERPSMSQKFKQVKAVEMMVREKSPIAKRPLRHVLKK